MKMSEKERRSTSNGIWLCQNCVKLIDNDLQAYSVIKLSNWKSVAEEEARTRVGRTRGKVGVRSNKQAVAALQRELKLRDDLHREGQAQQDKADAQRDAAKKEAEAESARGAAKANEKREARRAKKHAKTGGAEAQADAEEREGLDAPLEGMGDLPSDLNGEDVR